MSFINTLTLIFLACCVVYGNVITRDNSFPKEGVPASRALSYDQDLTLIYEITYGYRMLQDDDGVALANQQARVGDMAFQIIATGADAISLNENAYNNQQYGKALNQLKSFRTAYTSEWQASDSTYNAFLFNTNPPTLHNYDQELSYIKSQVNILNAFFSAAPADRPNAMAQFLNAYEALTDGDQSIKTLTANFQDIINEAKTSSKYYRQQVVDVGSHFLIYIAAGVSTQFVYQYQTLGLEAATQALYQWNSNLIYNQQAVDDAEQDCKNQLATQATLDIADHGTGATRGQVANNVISFFRSKYDWNDWAVVVTGVTPEGTDQNLSNFTGVRNDVGNNRILGFYKDKSLCGDYVSDLGLAVRFSAEGAAGLAGNVDCSQAIASLGTNGIVGNFACTKDALGNRVANVLDTGVREDTGGVVLYAL